MNSCDGRGKSMQAKQNAICVRVLATASVHRTACGTDPIGLMNACMRAPAAEQKETGQACWRTRATELRTRANVRDFSAEKTT